MSLCSSIEARVAAALYALCALTLFTASATHHLNRWSGRAHSVAHHLDHAGIFLIIAGTYTPLVLILGDGINAAVLPMVWVAASAGILLTLIGSNLPRYVTATPYVVLGWGAVVIMPAVKTQLGMTCFWLISAGGLAYTIGAIAYARRKPNPWPRIFGYHEIFHVLVLMAAATHYLAIYQALSQTSA